MQLKYSTGVKEFEVAGGTIRFNPSDPAFVHRLMECFDDLQKRQDDGETKNQQLESDGVALFHAIEERDAQMRNGIDYVFGPGSSQVIFPGISLYALADGLPVWCNFLLAVLDLVNDSVADAQNADNARIDFYMKKYSKYMKK